MRWFRRQGAPDRFEAWLAEQIETIRRQASAPGMQGVIAEFAYKLLQQVRAAYRAYRPGGNGAAPDPEDLPTPPGKLRRDTPKTAKKNHD